MKARKALVALVALIGSGTAMADGNLLLAQCQASIHALDRNPRASPDYNFGTCVGTVGGVMDTMINLHYDLTPEAKACFPDTGIQYGQAMRIVTQYLTNHPASLHESGVALSIRAFREAYPCK